MMITYPLDLMLILIDSDVTKKWPLKDNSVKFIWTERMLEHIQIKKITHVFSEMTKKLVKNGTARFCMPSCFYLNDQSINMMRPNNYPKQLRIGHVTWFTYEGVGKIKPEQFGARYSPRPNIFFEDLAKKFNLKFKLIRWFDKNHNLFYDTNYLNSDMATTFKDHSEIKIKRPNSLIFEFTKL